MGNKRGNILPGLILVFIAIILFLRTGYDVYRYAEIKILPSTVASIEKDNNNPSIRNFIYSVKNKKYTREIPYNIDITLRDEITSTIYYMPDDPENIYFLSGFTGKFYLNIILWIFCAAYGLIQIGKHRS